MQKDFDILDVSGDIGLKVYGENLEEVFRNGAFGLYSLITDISKVNPVEQTKVNVYGESLHGLYIGWLNELIFQFDTYGFIGSDIVIENLTERRIEATIKGEKFDPERHEKGLLVKAATYHNFKIEKKDGIWTVEVIFDI